MNARAPQLAETARTEATKIPRNEYIAPTYGGPQRDAINSVVDNIVQDITGKIAALRKTLDELEQLALEGAAGAKTRLNDHILVCVRVNDEVLHMQNVVAEIRQAATSVQ